MSRVQTGLAVAAFGLGIFAFAPAIAWSHWGWLDDPGVIRRAIIVTRIVAVLGILAGLLHAAGRF